MRVLVLGGYGLIGLTVVRRLLAAGHEVIALGRNVEAARASTPQAVWIATSPPCAAPTIGSPCCTALTPWSIAQALYKTDSGTISQRFSPLQ
jgi:NAD(P)-dependent dehydrogenase (short-subunit alcohol dehydrogenase family)